MNHTTNYNLYRNLYVRTGSKDAIKMAYAQGLLTEADYSKILGEEVPKDSFENKKDRMIAKSKIALAEYIAAHPLVSTCHGNKSASYSVTEEKQNMFSRKFAAHSALVTAGIDDVMTWNATGCPCEEWTDAECIQFIAETNAYVTPLVSYQQHLEVAIHACKTDAELDSIEIDFDSILTNTLPPVIE